MFIMWVLLVVALAFVVMLRLLVMRTRKFERILAERRAEAARLAAARAAREAAARRARELETGSGFDPRVTAEGQRQVLENALSVAPGLADATLIETRVGLRPLPEGDLPTVGALDGVPRLYVNAGFGAAGLTMGPLVGDRLAAIVAGETSAPEAGFLSAVR